MEHEQFVVFVHLAAGYGACGDLAENTGVSVAHGDLEIG
jgi:hypothetical protein